MPSRVRLFTVAAWISFALCAVHTVRVAHEWDMSTTPRHDFVQIFAGARCLLAHQDPYDTTQLEQQYIAAGGLKQHLAPWSAEPPLYPPSALLFGVPFARMTFRAAAEAWFWLSTLAMLGALATLPFLIETPQRPWAILLAACVVFYPTTPLVLGMGQPSGLAIPLILLSVVAALLSFPAALAATGLALALMLKLQLALPVCLYFFLTGRYRRLALLAGGALLLVMAGCVLWLRAAPASAVWSASLQSNLASAFAVGGIDNPGPSNPIALTLTNLQAVTSLFFSSPRLYNAAAFAVVLPIGLVWLASVVLRPWTHARDLLAVASAVCFAMLPAYSVYYNCALLGLTAPATVWLLFHRRRWGIAALVCSAPVAWLNLQLHVQHFVAMHPGLQMHGRMGAVLLYREYPLALTLTTAVLTAALWQCSPRGIGGGADFTPPAGRGPAVAQASTA
jgi:hypothetical protein